MKRSQERKKGRQKKGRANKRGVALIMTLGAITVLTVFLTELQEETSAALSAALAERDALRAEYHARSAINLSRLLIASEKMVRLRLGPILMMMTKSRQPPQIPVWNFTDMLLGPFNDAGSAQAFGSLINADMSSAQGLGLKGGRFELRIIDEDSKINVNIAAKNEFVSRDRLAMQLLGLMAPANYNPLFEGRDADGQFSTRQDVCGAIVDWADSDPMGSETRYPCDPMAATASSGGPEDNFYQTINLAYRRKNAAFDSLDELRLVRGMSDDFWATFVDPDPANPDKRPITVWGQGKINVASANAQTLLAVVCSDPGARSDPTGLCNDPMQQQSFVTVFSFAKSMSMGLPLFASANDFISAMQGKGPLGQMLQMAPTFLNMPPIKPLTTLRANDMKKAVTGESKVFSIYAEGVVPGNKRTTRVRIHAVVDFQKAQGIGERFPGMPPMGSGQPGSANAGAGQVPGNLMMADPAGTVVYWRVD